MPRSHHKNTNNVKDQASVFSPAPTSPGGMLVNENYLAEPQDPDFKRVITDFTKEFEEFKGAVKNRLKEMKEKRLRGISN